MSNRSEEAFDRLLEMRGFKPLKRHKKVKQNEIFILEGFGKVKLTVNNKEVSIKKS